MIISGLVSIATLSNFKSISPYANLDQEDLNFRTEKVHITAIEADGGNGDDYKILHSRYGAKNKQIATRGFENIELSLNGRDALEKNVYFGKRAQEIFTEFYVDETRPPEHIIHVTCTGYTAPSPAQGLVQSRNWTSETNVTHAYHMGCYASMPAIRMAEGFVSARGQSVDVVHTEMCGLHMDCQNQSVEQIVVQSLFADGHVKYRVEASHGDGPGLAVLKIEEQIIPDSFNDMTWTPASWGNQMTLSRHVPKKVKAGVMSMVERLIQGSEYSLASILKEAVFAVHPGGPKIIDTVAEALDLTEEQIRVSREILLNGGNRSSSTLPLIWQRILSESKGSAKPVISFAFGPGLTIYGALFVIV